jgi:MoaA/NifB/PqqE/SkfB family radical SAM enzyme
MNRLHSVWGRPRIDRDSDVRPDPARTEGATSADVAPREPPAIQESRGHRSGREGIVCIQPFYAMLIFADYKVYGCPCLDWIKHDIGNLKTNTLGEIWNSDAARGIRRRMYAGDWKDICNPICPTIIEHMRSNRLVKYEDLDTLGLLRPELIAEIRAGQDHLESPPSLFKLDNSNACNLHCIMCSREAINDDLTLQAKLMADLENFVPTTKRFQICGNGDPFVRSDTRQLMMRPTISATFDLITNGLMMPRYWDKVKHQQFGTIIVSVDAATKYTYEKIRAGGTWEDLLNSLALIRLNRDRFTHVEMNMTVMRSKIPQFIDMAETSGFNCSFQGIRGHYGVENIFEAKDSAVLNHLKNIVLRESLKKRTVYVGWKDLLTHLDLVNAAGNLGVGH